MESHLIKEIERRFKRLPASKRVSEVKEFMARSETNRRLVQKAFPGLYKEAISSRQEDAAFSRSEPDRPFELCAKPR
jgi:hypothetical protein